MTDTRSLMRLRLRRRLQDSLTETKLAADIKANAQLHPIIVDDQGRVVDDGYRLAPGNAAALNIDAKVFAS